MSSGPSLPSDEPPRPRKAPFGGWADYGLWAQHDFADRSQFEDAETPAAGPRPATGKRRPIRLPASGPGHSHDMRSRRDPCQVLPAGVDETGPSTQDDARQPDWAVVRPYVRSGGRASVADELAVETMISSTAFSGDERTNERITEEHRRIRKMCRVPQSVAEVATQINAPLGVAQVLIKDACELGLLKVHRAPLLSPSGRPTREVLSRIQAGLRKLA
ncbi:DUF742 domain-containing protein [Lentzea sp. NPDC051213]|uniref:DUF742 domain-containing protein n=1 Tax=Lentzea sp. NPDC051213 TaxID=3364126 RepID=UPI0037B4478F